MRSNRPRRTVAVAVLLGSVLATPSASTALLGGLPRTSRSLYLPGTAESGWEVPDSGRIIQ